MQLEFVPDAARGWMLVRVNQLKPLIVQRAIGAEKAPRIPRSAFGQCLTPLQRTPDRPRRLHAANKQIRPRQRRPSSRPQTRNTYSRSTGHGLHHIVERKTL